MFYDFNTCENINYQIVNSTTNYKREGFNMVWHGCGHHSSAGPIKLKWKY